MLESTNRIIADNIRRTRLRYGFTARELAAKTGCSEKYLIQLETGLISVSAAVLLKISKVLKAPLVDFFKESNQVETTPMHTENVTSIIDFINLVESYATCPTAPAALAVQEQGFCPKPTSVKVTA